MPRQLNFRRMLDQSSGTARELGRLRNVVRSAFQPPEERVRALSPDEQLQQFREMTQKDFQDIARRRGLRGLQQYIEAMENLQNAS